MTKYRVEKLVQQTNSLLASAKNIKKRIQQTNYGPFSVSFNLYYFISIFVSFCNSEEDLRREKNENL